MHAQLKAELDDAVQRVMASGWFILGPEVEAFEAEFAAYHDLPHAVGVANGTDAIELALRAYDIGAGDEVITVAHTAMPTVTAIEATGATPILIDIHTDSFLMDASQLDAAISPRTKAIIPVHLYGQMADMDAIMAIAEQHNLLVIEDCAQAHGARYKGKIAGTMGHIASFSFYPTKNLGAYGDGGAILTRDTQIAERLRRIRFYGQGGRYLNVERGTNSRLDEMQAAILRVKLQHLDQHNAERHALAETYTRLLQGVAGVITPPELNGRFHAHHLYVIRVPNRDALMAALKERGVGSLIHYPVPIHLQDSHADLNLPAGSLPVTEQIAGEILSLPLYIGLTTPEVEAVVNAVKASLS